MAIKYLIVFLSVFLSIFAFSCNQGQISQLTDAGIDAYNSESDDDTDSDIIVSIDIDKLMEDLSNASELTIETLDVPVKAIATSSTGIVPNPNVAGSWNIFKPYRQEYWHGEQLVMIDTASGNVNIQSMQDSYQSTHLFGQVPLADGRLFINVLQQPGLIQAINIYDATTNTIEIEAVPLPASIRGETHPMVMGTDGMIYCGGSYIVEGDQSRHATVVQINPTTLEVTDYGKIGPDHYPDGVWGYSVAADDTHVYIASGKIPWYLAAYNRETGEQATLLTSDTIGGNISVTQYQYGAIAHGTALVNGDQDGYYFLYNGQAFFTEDIYTTPPWGDDSTIPVYGVNYSDTLLPPRPEIALDAALPGSDGVGHIWYRPYDRIGDTGATPAEAGWQKLTFTVETFPQTIDRVLGLSDGRVLCSTTYTGFGTFDPSNNETLFLGGLHLSPYTMIEHDLKVYLSGYPSSTTFQYDMTKEWTQGAQPDWTPLDPPVKMDDPSMNPLFLGYFSEPSGSHKMFSSAVGANGSIYFGGRWYRNGDGGGLAWYNPQTGGVDGIYEIFSNYQIRYLTSASDGRYIVISTMGVVDMTLGKPTPVQGRIFVFDTQSNEIVRTIDPLPESISAGKVVGIGGDYVMGLSGNNNDMTWIYKLNVVTGEILFKLDIPTRTMFIAGDNQKYGFGFDLGPDGNIWVFLAERALTRISPEGVFDVVGKMPSGYGGFMAFSGSDIYLAQDSTLRRIAGVVQND
jgi:hypothetical protein